MNSKWKKRVENISDSSLDLNGGKNLRSISNYLFYRLIAKNIIEKVSLLTFHDLANFC